MLQTLEENLRRGEKLLNSVTDAQYKDGNTPPYFSSVGCHVRHILDVYQCVFRGLSHGVVDLTARDRNFYYEESAAAGLDYLHEIIGQLRSLKATDMNQILLVKDNLGDGIVEVQYTLASLLMQAHSHTIHHFAIIGFLVHSLGIELPDADFGYNPTTPKRELLG